MYAAQPLLWSLLLLLLLFGPLVGATSSSLMAAFGGDSTQLALYVSVAAATLVALLRWRRLVATGWRVLRRDVNLIYKFVLVKFALRRLRDDTTLAVLFGRTVARHPDKTMFVTHSRRWTYAQADEYSNRVANHFAASGFRAGDTIALLMENCPEYVLIWLGLSKIGVVTALINTNLRSNSLAHSISIVQSRAVIFSPATVCNLLTTSRDELRSTGCADLRFFAFGDLTLEEAAVDPLNAEPLHEAIGRASSAPPTYRGGRLTDKLMYIYTSGTTGLPKAAIVKHMRFIQVGFATTKVIPVTTDDVMYLYLPFYHAAAAILGASQPLLNGTTAAVGAKFSASNFWTECADFNVTVCQYIGEICRYLLMQPAKASDRTHSVRLMFGNGLRKDIWTEFRNRFGIADIRELYGSTEGISNLVNLDNTVGAIGSLPIISKLLGRRMPINIIRIDPVTGQPVRDDRGRCVECAPGEAGEIVAVISSTDPLARFDGYADRRATEKKIYRDCFREGDRVFASGDLVYRDALGYVYFKDRTGDTFRWKGENVATAEVESALSAAIASPLIGCCVYGVEVPGTEGRAGMAALVDPRRSVDLDALLDRLRTTLPAYAIPLFVRITSRDDTTGTFKMSKVNFQKAAFDLDRCLPDPVYFLDPNSKRYVPLDQATLARINDRLVRL